jgi:molecular chaperone GrpE
MGMTDEQSARTDKTGQPGHAGKDSETQAASAAGGAQADSLAGGVDRSGGGQGTIAEGGADRLAELEAQCAELKDQYLRAVAETENIRRRSQEEVAKAHKYGIESFAEALLPVRDSLELALKVDAPSIENLKEGVEATLRLMAAVFEKNRLLEIDPAGQKFDPNLHQAISMVPGASANPPVAANHVVAVLQKGYLINDRVLRPALVTVAQA